MIRFKVSSKTESLEGCEIELQCLGNIVRMRVTKEEFEATQLEQVFELRPVSDALESP